MQWLPDLLLFSIANDLMQLKEKEREMVEVAAWRLSREICCQKVDSAKEEITFCYICLDVNRRGRSLKLFRSQ